MSHKHHIIPKHAGGTDDPSNLIELSVHDHAEAHRVLYEQHGRWQDYVAWQGLANLVTKEELVRIIQSEAGKMCRSMYPNPFSGTRTGTNFAENPGQQQRASESAASMDSMQKRKKTFSERQHQQRENNSQFGTAWCVPKDAFDLSGRKKYRKDQIPEGWVTTTAWADIRKNKSNNAYGRHWYNDGIRNFYLNPSDPKIAELKLEKRRLPTNSCAKTTRCNSC